MQPPPFRSLSDRCQPAGLTTHLHTESKSSGSVQVVDRKMGLKAAHVSQKLRFCLCDAFDRKYTNAYTHAANSEVQECTILHN